MISFERFSEKGFVHPLQHYRQNSCDLKTIKRTPEFFFKLREFKNPTCRINCGLHIDKISKHMLQLKLEFLNDCF